MKLFRSAVLLPLLALLQTCPLQAANSPFKGIARLHTLSSKTKTWKAKATYPTFRSQTPLAKFATQKVALSQRHAYFTWLKSAKKDMKENPGGMLPYEYDSLTDLQAYSPTRVISIRQIAYQFLGGAHGGTFSQNRNFALIGGKPKELMLSDLFTPGTDYRKLVETRVFEQLRKNPSATWVEDKSVKFLTPAQFNNFQLKKDGVTWLFQEYEMGPFANGQVEATVPVADLGPNFRRSLLP